MALSFEQPENKKRIVTERNRNGLIKAYFDTVRTKEATPKELLRQEITEPVYEDIIVIVKYPKNRLEQH